MIKLVDMKVEMHEECGVFGVFNHFNASLLTYRGLNALQHRGQEGCGIVSSDGKTLKAFKGEGLVKNVFKKKDIDVLDGLHAIGHVRYSTFGGGGIHNVQPFLFHSQNGQLGLCHNGNLVNATKIRGYLEQQGSIFQTTADSEIIAHLIKRHRGEMMNRIKESLLYVEGSFAFMFLLEDELYVALDKQGLRPLSIATLGDGYVVSSETCAFDAVGATFLRDVLPGEVIHISKDGLNSSFYSEDRKHQMCMMEYVYFARPDSQIEGINVYQARKNSGKVLAKEAPVEADIVIGVPDSGMSAAVGYAEASKIPLELGLIKNKASDRTFIEPTQALRENAVSLKLSAVRSVIKDKRVVLVDDSIVRGTTIKQLIQLLKHAGAKEVHVRITSPEIKYPCFYGVDFSTYDELISAKYKPSEMKDVIGAHSIAFIS
ncbi:MAG: amidophosphoribosyltransferase, partial [Acholeplasmataceae bacterium]|nr:amidophosphoribosyltransferase [Acholeplasmataceae bacterium]